MTTLSQPRFLRPFALACLAAFLVLTMGTPLSAAAAQDLVLKRVLLSTGGVGYLEYEAQVSGDAMLDLDVRLDQVDDVMKSLVVFDDLGGVGSVRLAGRDALGQRFRDYPFSAEDLSRPARLLASLQGARIAISGPRDIAGRVLAVVPERVVLPDGLGTVDRHRLSVKTDDGVATVILEDAAAIRFEDPALDAQVEEALAALATHRRKDRRRLVITSFGQGERLVRVGMVVAMPLWKASYRLTLGETGRLQGWAVLENMSGQDWTDIRLTIVSGNPVTFRQALYESYYVDRPEVPVEVLGRVLPGADQGAVPQAPPPARPARMAASRAMMDERLQGAAEAEMAAMPAPKAAAMSAPAMAVGREASTAQVRFTVDQPITVRHGGSVMIPIIDQQTKAVRIALYQPATHARHPLAAVRLTNQAETGLPPGVTTLYEQGAGGTAYVGDARLAPLPAGESRLLSFALDQDILIDRETDTARQIVNASAARGIFRLNITVSETTHYRFKNSDAENRTLVIEHPRRGGWTLKAPADPELTDDAYRISVIAPAGESAQTDVVLERVQTEQIRLADMSVRDYEIYVQNARLPAEARQAFRALAEMRAEIDRLSTALARLEEERGRIVEDQTRLRENLQAVRPDTDLYARYVTKLDGQENSLEQLTRESDALRRALDAAETKLADAIAALTF